MILTWPAWQLRSTCLRICVVLVYRSGLSVILNITVTYAWLVELQPRMLKVMVQIPPEAAIFFFKRLLFWDWICTCMSLPCLSQEHVCTCIYMYMYLSSYRIIVHTHIQCTCTCVRCRWQVGWRGGYVAASTGRQLWSLCP